MIVAFRGASGSELAERCDTVQALTTEYEQVVEDYQVSCVDFDLEGSAISDFTSIDRRSAAIAALQQHEEAAGRALQVTLPALPTGLIPESLQVVRAALAAGVKLAFVNVLAMDYGHGAAPHPAGRMGR